MTDNFQDGVGKKIVEALKQQDDNGAVGFEAQEAQTQPATFNYEMPVDQSLQELKVKIFPPKKSIEQKPHSQWSSILREN